MSEPDCRSDGVWLWNGQLVHYVREHGVRLPPVFIEHMAASNSTPPEEVPDDAEVFERHPFLVVPESVMRGFRIRMLAGLHEDEQE